MTFFSFLPSFDKQLLLEGCKARAHFVCLDCVRLRLLINLIVIDEKLILITQLNDSHITVSQEVFHTCWPFENSMQPLVYIIIGFVREKKLASSFTKCFVYI